MSGKIDFAKGGRGTSQDHIGYIRQMLAELAQVARNERADLLAYLLEMAFTEASELLNGRSEIGKIEGNHSASMTVKPARKVQL
jgi:cytosine/adenosine deaminase-related metal-dependent hydrolase